MAKFATSAAERTKTPIQANTVKWLRRVARSALPLALVVGSLLWIGACGQHPKSSSPAGGPTSSGAPTSAPTTQPSPPATPSEPGPTAAPSTCPVATSVCSSAGSAALIASNPNDPNDVMDPNNPNDMGIDPGQCPSCLSCQPTGSATVAGCPSTIGTQEPCQSRCHVPVGTTVNYCTDPPSSGDHYPSPERRCGEHTTPVPRGTYVHSMEHGGVILTYNCPDGCGAQLQILREAVTQRQGHKVILTSDPLLQASKFAAASWTWVYQFDSPDLQSLLCFIDQHESQAPEQTALCQ